MTPTAATPTRMDHILITAPAARIQGLQDPQVIPAAPEILETPGQMAQAALAPTVRAIPETAIQAAPGTTTQAATPATPAPVRASSIHPMMNTSDEYFYLPQFSDQASANPQNQTRRL